MTEAEARPVVLIKKMIESEKEWCLNEADARGGWNRIVDATVVLQSRDRQRCEA